jgi:hypothetical protein
MSAVQYQPLIKPFGYYDGFSSTEVMSWKEVKATALAAIQSVGNLFLYLANLPIRAINFSATFFPCCRKPIEQKPAQQNGEWVETPKLDVRPSAPSAATSVTVLGRDMDQKHSPNSSPVNTLKRPISAGGPPVTPSASRSDSPQQEGRDRLAPGAPKKPPSPTGSASSK